VIFFNAFEPVFDQPEFFFESTVIGAYGTANIFSQESSTIPEPEVPGSFFRFPTFVGNPSFAN
jgi:hypothetical protein